MTAATRAMGAPLRYVQGPGELDRLSDHLAPWGRELLAIIDPALYEELSQRLEAVAAGSGLGLVPARFGGECAVSEVERLAALGGGSGVDVVVGLGGGKTLDTAKLVARDLGLPVVICPTSASTDAPVSAMAVLYHEDGRHLRFVPLDHAPELVLVDSAIILKAPPRLLVAGVGDALSTWYEAEANRASGTANYIGRGYRACLAARAVARACLDTVKARAAEAVEDLLAGRLTEALEDVIEANILLSGLGFENTGCAAAHALHTGLRELEGASMILHGETVSLGVLFQLVLEGAQEEALIETADFLAGLGLPVCLADMGLAPSEAEMAVISEKILDGSSGIEAEPFEITPESVQRALLGADRLGRERRRARPELRAALCSPAVRNRRESGSRPG